MHRQFISSCLSCSVTFFATNSSQFFNFLAICCMIFLEKLLLNSNSPHKQILSLWAWSAHRLAWCTWNRWDSNPSLISWNAISLRCVSQFLASTWASASYSFCWVVLSLLEQPSQLSVQGSFGDFFLSFNECTTFVSRSLLPLDIELKIVVATDALSNTASNFLVLVKTEHWNTDGCWNFAAACFRVRHIFSTGGDLGEIVWAQEPRMVAGILDRQSLILRSWLLWSNVPHLDCVSKMFDNVPSEEQCDHHEVLLFLVVSEWI